MTNIAKHFYDYLSGDSVICGSRAKNSTEAITEMAKLLCSRNSALDERLIINEVLEREELYPTMIAPGLAVPHARLKNLDAVRVALITSPDGIDFHMPEMGKARVAVLILTPQDDPGLHLQLLSALSNDFSDGKAVDRIAACETPKDVMTFLCGARLRVPDYLRVSEIMNPNPVTILEQTTLQEAIRIFARSRKEQLPVVDEQGDLRGLLTLNDLLQYSLPEHLLWLDDLSPMYRFQPFSEVLRTADESKVADIMSEDFVKISEEVPAIQLAKLFLQNKTQSLIVTRGEKKLAGVVELKDFCAKLFWE